MRIPWWISRPVLSSFGPSPIRRAARFAFYAAVLSRVSPLLHGAAAGKRPPSSAGGQGRKPAGPRGGGPGGGGPGGGPRGGGPRGGRPGGGPRGAGPGRQAGGASPQPGGAGPGGAPGGTGGQSRGMPAAGGAGPKRQSSGPGPQPAGRTRRGPSGGGAGRGGTMPRQAQGGAVPAGSRPAPGRAGQAWPPLPGMPPRPRTPRPGQRVLPFEVTRMPRSGASGPRPAPAPPQRPARPRPAQPPLPGMPGRARPPRQLQLPLGPPPARASPGSGQPAPAPPGTCLPRCRASRKVITGELRPARQHPDPRRYRAPGQDPGRADRPPGRHPHHGHGHHLGGVRGHPAPGGAAGVRRPGRASRRGGSGPGDGTA